MCAPPRAKTESELWWISPHSPIARRACRWKHPFLPERRDAIAAESPVVEEWRQSESVFLGETPDLVHPAGRDVPAPAGIRLESSFERQEHSLEKTTLNDVRRRMRCENGDQIRSELQSFEHLPHSTEEDDGTGCPIGNDVLRIAGVADDRVRADRAQRKARRGQARRCDDEIGLGQKLLRVGRNRDGRCIRGARTLAA